MGLLQPNDGWRISDALWAKIEPLVGDDHPGPDRLSARTKVHGHAFDEALDQDGDAAIVDERDGPWNPHVDGLTGKPARTSSSRLTSSP